MLDMNLMESIVAEYCAQRDYFEIKIHDWALSRNISSQKCRNICHLATKSWMDTFCASILVYKDIVKEKTWIHLLKGKIGGYNFKLFLPQLEYMKELCFPPLRTCICTAANITDSLQGHAIMHVLYFGLEAHFADFSRMSFFHCQPLNYYRCTRKDRSDNLWKLDQCKGLTAFLTSL